MQNILVIKLGALGDFIQATGPMAAIRKHHKDAHITLLTTAPFEAMGRECGYFDAIQIDERPKWYQLGGWLKLRQSLIAGGYDRVYDLQNNDRSSLYFQLLPKSKRPEWVGIAKGASHRNISPERTAGHAFDGHVQTLALAGIKDVKVDPLQWMQADISDLGLQKPYILLAPGSAPDRPEKRWPAQHFGELAQQLHALGYQPVLLGTKAEQDVTDAIAALCPKALNLNSRTSLYQIAALGRDAALAIGNDTGPMHLVGATRCPCLVLFSQHSNPVRHAPKGDHVQILQKEELADLGVSKVLQTVQKILPQSAQKKA